MGIINLIETYSVYVNNVLMLDQATGQVNYLTCFFAFGIPLALVIYIIKLAFKSVDEEAEPKKGAGPARPASVDKKKKNK